MPEPTGGGRGNAGKSTPAARRRAKRPPAPPKPRPYSPPATSRPDAATRGVQRGSSRSDAAQQYQLPKADRIKRGTATSKSGKRATAKYRQAVAEVYLSAPPALKERMRRHAKGPEARIIHAVERYFAERGIQGDRPYTDAERAANRRFTESEGYKRILAQTREVRDLQEKGLPEWTWQTDPKKLEAMGFAPEGLPDKLLKLPVALPVVGGRAAAATAVAAAHDPVGVPSKTAAQGKDAILALPGALAETVMHPVKSATETVQGIEDRTDESFDEKVERIREEGALTDISDAMILAAGASAAAKPALAAAIRRGLPLAPSRMPRRAARVTSGGTTRPVREGGLIRLSAGELQDRIRAATAERQTARAERGGKSVDPLVRRAAELNREAGEVVAAAPGRLRRAAAQRKTVSKQRARGVFGLKRELQIVGDKARRAVARLNDREQRAFYYGATYGIKTPEQGREILTDLRAQIVANRESAGFEPRGGQLKNDMLPEIDAILAAPAEHFTPRLRETLDELTDDSIRVAREDPRYSERQTDLRRYAPFAEVTGLERGVDVPSERRGAERMKVREADPDEFEAAYDKAAAGARGAWLTDYTPEERREMKLLLNEAGTAGAAVKPDGDIVNVFRLDGAPKGSGKAMVREAIKQGGVKLDALGSKLRDIYADLGFQVYKTEKWDPAYGEAPDPADSDVYYMALPEAMPKQPAGTRKATRTVYPDVTDRERELVNATAERDLTPEEIAEVRELEAARLAAAKEIEVDEPYFESSAPGSDAAETLYGPLLRSIVAGGLGEAPDTKLPELRFDPDETPEAFLDRLRAAREERGLAEPLYFRSERYAEEPGYGDFAVGGKDRMREDAPYGGGNLALGLQDTGINVYLRGLSRNVKAKHNKRLVDDLLTEHVIAKYSTGDKTLREVQDALERDGVDRQAVAYWNPGVYAETMRRLDDDIPEELADLGDSPSAKTAFEAATSRAAADLPGWKVVPLAAMRELEHELSPSMAPGRAYDVAKGWASRMILLTGNVPWLGAQLVQNMLGGAAATGGKALLPSNWRGAYKEWKALSPDERAVIGGHLGLDATAADTTMRRMGGHGGLWTKTWRQLHDWGGWKKGLAAGRGPSVSDFNPIQAMAKLDRAQNNAARIVVWHTMQKRAEVRELEKSASGLHRLQTKIMATMGKRDGLEQLKTDPKLLEQHADAVIKFMGDFASLTAFERKFIGRSIMFYPFARFSARLAFYTLPIEHPLVGGLVASIALQEAEEREEMFGPDSLRWTGGKVYLPGNKAIDLSKLNPLGNSVIAALGNDRPAALLGVAPPFVGMLYNQASDKDYFSGSPQFYQGDPSSPYAQGVSELPLINGTRLRLAGSDILSLSSAYRALRDNEINPLTMRHDPRLEGYQGADSLAFAPAPVEFGSEDPSKVDKMKAAMYRENEIVRESNDGLLHSFIPFLPERERDAAARADRLAIAAEEAKPKKKRRRGGVSFNSGSSGGFNP